MQKYLFNLPNFAVLLLFLVRAPAGCNVTKLINGNIIYSFCSLTPLPRLFFSLLLVLFHFPVLPAISFCERFFFNGSTGSKARTSLEVLVITHGLIKAQISLLFLCRPQHLSEEQVPGE